MATRHVDDVHDGDRRTTTPAPASGDPPAAAEREVPPGRTTEGGTADGTAGRSAARTPRGGAPRETALARYLRDIAAYPLLSREEEHALARRIRAGDRDALDRLVVANLRFVVLIAKRYQHHGLPLSDLINEGNLGLIHAAHRFDETRGVKFVAYAVWWVRQAILQALAEQSRIVRVPMHRAGMVHRVARRAAALQQELGREATHAEIAEGMDITEEEVAQAVSISRAHVSLDAPLAPGEDNRLLDYLADDSAPSPDTTAVAQALSDLLRESLSRLQEREARILRLYFGLDGEEPMTLEQIGALLGITRERVRQIREKALAQLRAGRLGTALSEFH